MHGLMMDFPLTLTTIFRRAEQMFRSSEIVSRLPDKSLHRYTYAEWADRTRRLARVLLDRGIRSGDRVATLGWNHGSHLEAYFGIPLIGGVRYGTAAADALRLTCTLLDSPLPPELAGHYIVLPADAR